MLRENNRLRVLFAPLDWGLGHTTRIVPLIRHFKSLNYNVLFAGNHSQQRFIETIFPGIEKYNLEGYNIHYANNEWLNKATIASQIPTISATIKREHYWLKGHIEQLQPDIIISDNRYGLYYPGIRSVILTHQLRVLTGMGAWADGILQKWHYSYLDKFDEIWVPDNPEVEGLSGKLGHPDRMPGQPVQYIGPLTQFHGLPKESTTGNYILVLLSGPEPQRSKLERLLLTQCRHLQRQFVFVGGTETTLKNALPDNIQYVARASGAELGKLIAGAELVICRSGYSTIMDLYYFGKKAILIPTPGQTEQEYLAKYHSGKGWCLATSQAAISVDAAINTAKKLQLPTQSYDYSLHLGAIDHKEETEL